MSLTGKFCLNDRGGIDQNRFMNEYDFFGKLILKDFMDIKNLLTIVLKKIHLFSFVKNMYLFFKGIIEGPRVFNSIIKNYSSSSDEEDIKFVKFIEQNKSFTKKMFSGSNIYLFIFADKFVFDYLKKEYFVNYFDDMPYVVYRGKKLFMPQDWTIPQMIQYVRGIDIEQSPLSPHCYFPNYQDVDFNNKVFVDIGGAEGNFAIEFIDKIKYLYIFEAEKKWIKPLKYTYMDWQNKVKIIESFVGDGTNKTVSLDSYFYDCDQLDYIKMDVEGFEKNVLQGAKDVISRFKNLVLLVCVYHYDNQENDIVTSLKDYNFVFRKGKMWFPGSKIDSKHLLRHCLIEAHRN